MRVVNTSKNTILADNAELADTFSKRLIGLLSRKSLNKGEALILSPSNSVHSVFMRFTIDVAFLDKTGKVVATLPAFKPFQLSLIYFSARTAIELPENTLELTQTHLGDIIKII